MNGLPSEGCIKIFLLQYKLQTLRNRNHHNIDVTQTELSADPVKKMGKVGCQSTVVIAAL